MWLFRDALPTWESLKPICRPIVAITIATRQTLIFDTGDGRSLQYSDIFFWALMAGSFDLAKLCWPLTSQYALVRRSTV